MPLDYSRPKAPRNENTFESHQKVLKAMDTERQTWFPHWREISDYFLPRKYPWLMTQKEVQTAQRRNTKLLDSTSTLAVRTLASGMMNGITSPARPWFRLRIAGFNEESLSVAAVRWLEEVMRRMYLALSESNFYNSMALLYLEWCTFGTASMTIYEDRDDIFRCYNHPLGEFYLSHDNTQRINRHGRRVAQTLEQIVMEFGLENIGDQLRLVYERKDASLLQTYEIAHLIERNDPSDGLLRTNAEYREVYWRIGCQRGEYLAVRPFYEWPTVTPRWELQGNDVYGTSPAMDALPDTIQLQKITLEKAQGLEKMIRPALIVDAQLQNRPKAFGAGGITYASTFNSNFGARPAYDVRIPFQELHIDIETLRQRIRETCHNNLFNMISQLETVRSASEIEARREEKLVHLGPVLERFYNEGLDPALKRVYGIMSRLGLFPEPPAELDGLPVEVQYVSILSDAQRAVGTMNIERFFAFTGQLAGVYPEVRNIPNVDELIRDYAEGIGIKPSGLRSREEVAEATEADTEMSNLAATAAIGKDLAAGAAVAADLVPGGGVGAVRPMPG